MKAGKTWTSFPRPWKLEKYRISQRKKLNYLQFCCLGRAIVKILVYIWFVIDMLKVYKCITIYGKYFSCHWMCKQRVWSGNKCKNPRGIWAGGLQWGEKGRDWIRLKIERWVKKPSHQRFHLFIVQKAEKMKHSVIQKYIHNYYNYKAKHTQKGSSWGEARVENGFRNRHSGASKALMLFYFLSWMMLDTRVQFIIFFK